MKLRRILSLLLIVAMLACLCVPVSADGELFFVAVNDTIPLTLTVFPTYSGGTLYVPYQVFDSQPCGVTPSYNQTRQTYVLFNRSRQMLFDLAAGTVSDEKLSAIVRDLFDLRPGKIITKLDLRRPIYEQTAAYGHFGRTDVDLPWEHTDMVEALKAAL